MTKQVPSTALPLSAKQLDQFQKAAGDLSPLQLAWISGYFWGQVADSHPPRAGVLPPEIISAVRPITLLSASQTGNARQLAEELRDDLIAAQLAVVLIKAGDYKFKHMSQEKVLLVVTSTQGDGDPPEEAIALYKYLFSKKAPAMTDTHFAVFGLGDRSYQHFAKTGKDFDSRLAELGAQRLHDRVDADVNYQLQAEAWRTAIVERLKAWVELSRPVQQKVSVGSNSNNIDVSSYTKNAPLSAHLLLNQKITSRESLKDVRHLEIDLADSGLHYQPGDALGVWYENDPALINELLELLLLKGDEPVDIAGKTLCLSEALKKHYELTHNTPALVEGYTNLVGGGLLSSVVQDQAKLQHFALATPIVDMVRYASIALRAEQLLKLLRPLTPRLYSISSSQADVGEEVHITVGVVRYEINGRGRSGGASSFLADRLREEDELRVFIEHNDNFRLPSDPDTPIIMIGPGTGVAPFRAFLQQRAADGAPGKNWLFFGNPHFIDDFLYQVEWQRYVKEGLLSNIDLAWSRDQAQKIYVQDRIREKGAEVWHWIQQNAHIYVCGDARHMARDVEQALLAVVAKHGNMHVEQADEFLSELRIERRYQRDVY
ncbi:NADPH-dependent assimilatory sulfite reductase flavoprotein subunit [secondary endosymbiont of Ctenarytaina eucalypti]|uniref:Sulfite reductase [NADPH] flavoprotein alpha-component n=1 Tax=secondary endosymbiont of Ctenarytaina eucalypti TaxID=1199245 RepID=J3Z2W9_9ENTR|nr:NADPH-dependent assimilatory sulfite reductase flavoprotein subunit [secondary endosymbiont of Ctenarytaina eucalypti]AFP84554.1 sulfite reductase (NADPH) flavoprotein, alpha-component [secondary endosymbiont of Ctenarytaina eucalypti]